MPEQTAPSAADHPPPDSTARPRPSAGRFRTARNVGIGVVCVVILGLGVGSFQGLSGLKEEPPRTSPQEPVYQVEVYEVETADVQRIISAFGTARSDRAVVVSAEIAGRIVEADRLKVGRPVVGDRVEISDDGRSQRLAGDVVVRIDPDVYQQRVERVQKLIEQLEQEHESNQRLLEAMTRIYDTKQELVDQGAGSATELQRIELELKQFRASVEGYEEQRAVYQADLELARMDLQKATVRPPFSGIIAQVMAEEGQFVQTGEPLFRLTDNGVVEVPVSISLADSVELASELAAGRFPAAALAVSETAPPRWFGNVMRIAPIADEETRTVDVFIEVHNDEQDVPLSPGTFLHVRINGAVMQETVLIPRDAVIDGSVFVVAGAESDAGGAATRAQRREITVEGTVQSLAVIGDGVRNGEEVVLTNLDVIDEGTMINTGTRRTLDDELARNQPAYAVRVDREQTVERPGADSR